MKNIFIAATACTVFLLAGKSAGAQNNTAKPQQQTPAFKKPAAATGQSALVTDPKPADVAKNVNAVELKAAKPAEGLTPKNIDRPRASTIVEIPKKDDPAAKPAPQATIVTKEN